MGSSKQLISGVAAVLGVLGLLGVAQTAAAQSDGEDLFDLCVQCHGSEGGGDALALAPAIAGLEEWYVKRQLENFRAGLRGKHPDDVGGLRMHPMSLSLREDEDLAAVSAYVASLPPTRPPQTVEGGDAEKGGELYTTCGACHGQNAAGNEAMNAPRLRWMNDWYLLSSLEKYKAGIRGGNPENQNAVMMRGMAAQLTDEQAMKDVIAHIQTLTD